jgi:hypothetical protein
MTFRSDLWTRFEFKGTPIYVRGDKPDWFVPNEAGDQILQEIARSGRQSKTTLANRRASYQDYRQARKPSLRKTRAISYKWEPQPYTDAVYFATIALSQLSRIRPDDPEREKALKMISDWLDEQRREGQAQQRGAENKS